LKAELRPYQEKCIEAVNAAIARGRRRVLYVQATGTGKTVVFCALIDQFVRQERRPALVLAHRDELLTQASRRIERDCPGFIVGKEGGKDRARSNAHVVVASVQSVGRAGTKRLDWLEKHCPSIIVCDECFPAGSLVDGKPIETIKAGDLVRSFNHDAGEIEIKCVTAVMRQPVRSLVRVRLSNGQQIVCTPNHPFWSSDNQGNWMYRPAGIINHCDVMVSTTQQEFISHGQGTSIPPVPYVRERSSLRHQTQARQLEQEQSGLLLRPVSGRIPKASIIGNDGKNKSGSCFRANEDEQPHEKRDRSGQGFDIVAGDGVEAAGTRGQRQGFDGSSNVDGVGFRLGYGSDCPDENNQGDRHPNALQNRYWQQGPQNSDRDRRSFSQFSDSQGAGSEEDGFSHFARVDGVEILEPGRDGTFGGLCPDGYVYNFEVEHNHNYFVNDVLVHNCHHAAAQGYQNVFERFGAYDGRSVLVGCTATPKRLDRKALHSCHGATFEEQVFDYPIRQGIEEGYLCQIKGYRVVSGVDISGVGKSGDDFKSGELATKVNVSPRTEKAIDHWQEVAGNRKTIVFCASVQHAMDAMNAWRERGVEAECIHGALDSETRKGILGRLNSGQTQLVTNCEVLTEGFDQPDLSCVVMLRPTTSWALYMQMVGRGTRIAPGKDDCIIIDVVDNTAKHSLATVPAIVDLPPGLDLEGRSVTEVEKEVKAAGAAAAAIQDVGTLSELETRLLAIDFFARIETPSDVAAVSPLNWLAVPGGYYLACGDNKSVRITQDALGEYSFVAQDGPKTYGPHSLGDTMDTAFAKADSKILSVWPSAKIIADRGAMWRNKRVTDAQRNILKRRYSDAQIDHMTKGQASAAIDRMMSGWKKRK